MRISRLTIDKLGVKLYDNASAVVAELVANSYDADATKVEVYLPLDMLLAKKQKNKLTDLGYEIVVVDNGTGMTPQEARDFYLKVGTDRRRRAINGPRSREKNRAVMGRKGIGKLAPFGICRKIEVISSGGKRTGKGYITSHFYLDFDKIVQDDETPVPLESGPLDGTYAPERGTTIRLTSFLHKRISDHTIFLRQLARRFSLADEDFTITVIDTNTSKRTKHEVPQFQIPTVAATRLNAADFPLVTDDGFSLPVTGWLALAEEAYKNEEVAGVRIYARGKIVATTRDFEQPAGYTGEFTTRSYLVGELHAEWLDADDDEDLIRTDRQGILWDSELGQALRSWGALLIREIGRRSKEPRRQKKSSMFMQLSNLEEKARERYTDELIVSTVVDLGKRIGSFASEDELGDTEYVVDLAEVVLTLAPQQALIAAFREIAQATDASLEDLVELFNRARVAELASYGFIADQRVKSIRELEDVILRPGKVDERELQALIARAPWLIRPDWTLITENQALKTFRNAFAAYWAKRYGEDIDIAISFETKRPDFTLISVLGWLHIVELKAPGHAFDDADYARLENYLESFGDFATTNPKLMENFGGWVIELIADDIRIKNRTAHRALKGELERGSVVRRTWVEFLTETKNAHSDFLDAQDRALKELGD